MNIISDFRKPDGTQKDVVVILDSPVANESLDSCLKRIETEPQIIFTDNVDVLKIKTILENYKVSLMVGSKYLDFDTTNRLLYKHNNNIDDLVNNGALYNYSLSMDEAMMAVIGLQLPHLMHNEHNFVTFHMRHIDKNENSVLCGVPGEVKEITKEEYEENREVLKGTYQVFSVKRCYRTVSSVETKPYE